MTESIDNNNHLESEVQTFTREIEQLLTSVFSGSVSLLVRRLDDRRVIATERAVLLHAKGVELASLHISIKCRLDSTRKYLAVENSAVKLVASLDRNPIIRWEYDRDAYGKPCAHIQVHGHRGALSHLLSQAGHLTPHSMESLHLPVGGARFRPCLEDIIEFLIRDCQLDAKPGWKAAVYSGRERWRRYQARTVVRELPADAAEVLRGLGYSVTAPEDGDPPDSAKALQTW